LVVRWHAGFVVVREASPEDAARLAELGARTFADAFAAQNTPEDIAEYVAHAFAPETMAAEIADCRARWLLASIHAADVGYAKLFWGEPPPCVCGAQPIELERFYVAAAWHGRRVAHALMSAALDRVAGRAIWLGVWEKNARAIAFYRKWGFQIVGAKTFALGADIQVDHVMLRAAQGTPSFTSDPSSCRR
jgi:ribosomal protein S18 acetylase RimI-like enzyme